MSSMCEAIRWEGPAKAPETGARSGDSSAVLMNSREAPGTSYSIGLESKIVSRMDLDLSGSRTPTRRLLKNRIFTHMPKVA